MSLRVAVVSTGGVGSVAVRAVCRRPDLELVAVWVHAAEKVGVDAGEIVGVDPVGVRATGELDDVIAARPDCVVYGATGPELDAAAVRDYVRLLSAGINVVTTSSPGLMYPDGWIPALVSRVRDAASTGGATIYASGLEPGFAADHLVVLLTTMSSTVTSIRAQEIFDYSSYPNTFMMCDVFGFGRPMDYTPLIELEGAQASAWGPPVRLVADALGLELDRIDETYERVPATRDLTTASGPIAAGTCGAVRLQTIGVAGGEPMIVIEHVNRMAPDLAPEWARADRDGTYRILIDGEPSVTCEFTVGAADSASVDGMVATAMRVVNAIPYVVAAEPGIATSVGLPLTLPRHVQRG